MLLHASATSSEVLPISPVCSVTYVPGLYQMVAHGVSHGYGAEIPEPATRAQESRAGFCRPYRGASSWHFAPTAHPVGYHLPPPSAAERSSKLPICLTHYTGSSGGTPFAEADQAAPRALREAFRSLLGRGGGEGIHGLGFPFACLQRGRIHIQSLGVFVFFVAWNQRDDPCLRRDRILELSLRVVGCGQRGQEDRVVLERATAFCA